MNISTLRKYKKEEQTKSKAKIKEIIKTTVEINRNIEKQQKKINKTKS